MNYTLKNEREIVYDLCTIPYFIILVYMSQSNCRRLQNAIHYCRRGVKKVKSEYQLIQFTYMEYFLNSSQWS